MEALLKLLGGSADERLRFWEIVKGITTPAEYRLANGVLRNIASSVDALQKNLGEIQKAAREVR